ncbi:hypothetical protein ACPUYX_13855 [Desulfosporosinus sp. SYSU MS00001]|uniref:hypothetical protein n=1 Tax=Desulfosporosinus sp. SYSU MS00001 TaxID=3416284 RepID=UPI003CF6FB47
MTKPAFTCVGFEPRKAGLNPNCGNCMNWKNESCSVRYILDELYAETERFKAIDWMMRKNKGIQGLM